MAKTATKTEPKTASGSKTKVTTGKGQSRTITSGLDELSALAVAGRELEGEERAKASSNLSFISLVGKMSGATDKNSPYFIQGAKQFDFVINSKKLILGQSPDVTILGMFKVYAEVTPKKNKNEMAKTVRFWHPEDAMQFPLAGYFDRPLPNGNVLQPVHWMPLYLHDHPEIEDALVSYRSTGNTYYSKVAKLIRDESSVCTELTGFLSYFEHYNKDYEKTDYYPNFEITGRNFKLTEDGKVMKTKDSKVDAATLKEILERSKKAHDDYKNFKMVSKVNTVALLGTSGQGALAAPAYTDDDEDEDVAF